MIPLSTASFRWPIWHLKLWKASRADCRKFYDENFDLISNNLTDAGRDFWFTRCHHGAGFWDGDWTGTR